MRTPTMLRYVAAAAIMVAALGAASCAAPPTHRAVLLPDPVPAGCYNNVRGTGGSGQDFTYNGQINTANNLAMHSSHDGSCSGSTSPATMVRIPATYDHSDIFTQQAQARDICLSLGVSTPFSDNPSSVVNYLYDTPGYVGFIQVQYFFCY